MDYTTTSTETFAPTKDNLARALALLATFTDIKNVDAAIRKLAGMKYEVGFHADLAPLNCLITLRRQRPEQYDQLYQIAYARKNESDSPSIRGRRKYMREYMRERRAAQVKNTTKGKRKTG